jgi:23S rRNA (uridine2552-2'-O)-methyltransferase
MAYTPQDRYFKKAKQEGYRSRAAYKLIELQQRFRIMRPGDSVVDLGAAPGGWLQVAAKTVGEKGKVIGVDLQAIQPFQERNITLIQGDITAPEIQQKIKELTKGPVNCVLSDMAPKLSGIRDADMARCLDLNRTALQVAIALLKPGGVLLLKSFISDDLQIFTVELKNHFSAVQRTKPEATRQGSSEFYFYAKGFHPRQRISIHDSLIPI